MKHEYETSQVKMPNSMLKAILLGSHNITMQGLPTQTVVFAYYVARRLPFNILEMDNAVSFSSHWQLTLRPMAKAMLDDISGKSMVNATRALDIIRRVLHWRSTKGMDVWYQLYAMYGLQLLPTDKLEEDEKVTLIHAISEAFHSKRALLRSGERINEHAFAGLLNEFISNDLPKRTRLTMLEEGRKAIVSLVNLFMYNSGVPTKLNYTAELFLDEMFEEVLGVGIHNKTLPDFIISTSGYMEKSDEGIPKHTVESE